MMDDPEAAVRELESSGQYRVLRKVDLTDRLAYNDGTSVRTGVFIDIESTGLDHSTSETIELGMVPFDYTADGRIFSIGAAIHQFHEPRDPIPSEITAITGLTDEIAAGHRLDINNIEALAERTSLFVAHNAAFDRPFAEQISPIFATKPWACTMCDVPWRNEGIEGRRLSDLLAQFRLFFDAHRAVGDCQAGIALLTMPLPKSGERVLGQLLQVARRPTWRLFASDAPFAMKDILRRRRYRWNTDPAIGPRAWYTDVIPDRLDEEVSYLQNEIYRSEFEPPMYQITAFQRYSARSK